MTSCGRFLTFILKKGTLISTRLYIDYFYSQYKIAESPYRIKAIKS